MQSLFGLDLTTAQKVLVAAAVILVLLALLGLFVRQIQGGRLRLRGQGSGRTRQPRLGVVDIHDLDRQRQLLLIRRDNVEHLVMVGGASDVVIETNIVRGAARQQQPLQAELPLADRPLPFDTLLPTNETARPEPIPERRGQPPVQQPAAPMPEPVPQRQVQSFQNEPAVPALAGAGFAAAVAAAVQSPEPEAAPAVRREAPSFAREQSPPPTVSPGELDDMARQLEEALKRPFSAVRPGKAAEASSPGPSPVPAAVPVVEPVVPVPVPELRPEPEPQRAPEPQEVKAAAEPVKPPPPPAPAPEPVREPPPAIPHDVEAELAMALGLKPEHVVARDVPAPTPRLAPAPQVIVPPPPAEIVAPVVELPAPEPDPEPKPEPKKASEPLIATEVEPADVPAPSPAKEPLIIDVREAVIEAVALEEKREPTEIDPFSVDAIEAEFARLLGRDPKAKS